MLSQVSASQNSRKMIDKIHNDFQLFACIITERFDNTPKDQSNYYFREESKKEYKEETTQNIADKLLTSLQRNNQSRRQAKKIELSWNLTFTKLFCNRDSTRFTSKYEFKHVKIIKIYHINLSTKNIKFLRKGFIPRLFFCTGGLFYAQGPFLRTTVPYSSFSFSSFFTGSLTFMIDFINLNVDKDLCPQVQLSLHWFFSLDLSMNSDHD